MPRKRQRRFTTFAGVNLTNRTEDYHFVTPYNCDGNFAFTLPSSISEEIWLESLKDISSNISFDKSADKNNNKYDDFAMVSSAIQTRFPQLEEQIPLFVAKMITSGPQSHGKKDGHVRDNAGLRLEEMGERAFGSIASNEMNQGRRIKDNHIVEDIIFEELISDLGDITHYDFDREEGQSGKKTLDEDDNLDWISELDDDESDDQIQRLTRLSQPDDEFVETKKRKFNKKYFPSDKSRQLEGFGGITTLPYTVLMAGSTSGIEWKVKRYESTDRQMDVLLKPDHEPNIDEILLVIKKVVRAVFEKKYSEDIDKNRVKICLVPQGLDPITLWIGSPESFVLVDFITKVRNKLELHKEISLYFGITLRFSREQENDKAMMKKVMKFVEAKKSIIKVKNDDCLGLARSIMLAMYHPTRENHPSWSSLRKGGLRPSRLLDRLIRDLHSRSGVPIKKIFSTSDFDAFQKVLPVKYRLVILGDPWSRKIIYAGPHAQSNIYVFNFEDLYFAVIRAAGFYSSSYFCGKCLKRHENNDHICKQKDL